MGRLYWNGTKKEGEEEEGESWAGGSTDNESLTVRRSEDCIHRLGMVAQPKKGLTC